MSIVNYLEKNGKWHFNYSSTDVAFKVRWTNRFFGLFSTTLYHWLGNGNYRQIQRTGCALPEKRTYSLFRYYCRESGIFSESRFLGRLQCD